MSTRNESGSRGKFANSNLNALFGATKPGGITAGSNAHNTSRTENSFGHSGGTGVGAVGRGRMVSLGTRQVATRSTSKVAIPKPVNLPSLKKEHGGNNPNVSIVPTGATGWRKADDSPVQLEAKPESQTSNKVIQRGTTNSQGWRVATPGSSTALATKGFETQTDGASSIPFFPTPKSLQKFAGQQRSNLAEFPSLRSSAAQSSAPPSAPSQNKKEPFEQRSWAEDDRDTSGISATEPSALASDTTSWEETYAPPPLPPGPPPRGLENGSRLASEENLFPVGPIRATGNPDIYALDRTVDYGHIDKKPVTNTEDDPEREAFDAELKQIEALMAAEAKSKKKGYIPDNVPSTGIAGGAGNSDLGGNQPTTVHIAQISEDEMFTTNKLEHIKETVGDERESATEGNTQKVGRVINGSLVGSLCPPSEQRRKEKEDIEAEEIRRKENARLKLAELEAKMAEREKASQEEPNGMANDDLVSKATDDNSFNRGDGDSSQQGSITERDLDDLNSESIDRNLGLSAIDETDAIQPYAVEPFEIDDIVDKIKVLQNREQLAIPEDLRGQILDQVPEEKVFPESDCMIKPSYLEKSNMDEDEIPFSSLFPPTSTHLPLSQTQPPVDHSQIITLEKAAANYFPAGSPPLNVRETTNPVFRDSVPNLSQTPEESVDPYGSIQTLLSDIAMSPPQQPLVPHPHGPSLGFTDSKADSSIVPHFQAFTNTTDDQTTSFRPPSQLTGMTVLHPSDTFHSAETSTTFMTVSDPEDMRRPHGARHEQKLFDPKLNKMVPVKSIKEAQVKDMAAKNQSQRRKESRGDRGSGRSARSQDRTKSQSLGRMRNENMEDEADSSRRGSSSSSRIKVGDVKGATVRIDGRVHPLGEDRRGDDIYHQPKGRREKDRLERGGNRRNRGGGREKRDIRNPQNKAKESQGDSPVAVPLHTSVESTGKKLTSSAADLNDIPLHNSTELVPFGSMDQQLLANLPPSDNLIGPPTEKWTRFAQELVMETSPHQTGLQEDNIRASLPVDLSLDEPDSADVDPFIPASTHTWPEQQHRPPQDESQIGHTMFNANHHPGPSVFPSFQAPADVNDGNLNMFQSSIGFVNTGKLPDWKHTPSSSAVETRPFIIRNLFGMSPEGNESNSQVVQSSSIRRSTVATDSNVLEPEWIAGIDNLVNSPDDGLAIKSDVRNSGSGAARSSSARNRDGDGTRGRGWQGGRAAPPKSGRRGRGRSGAGERAAPKSRQVYVPKGKPGSSPAHNGDNSS